jgi:hypothetical protein
MDVCRISVMLFALACAGPLRAQAVDPADLSPVARLGLEIYQQDRAAWIATDAALQAGLAKTPARGWITLVNVKEARWLVRFIGECPQGACAYLDVNLSADNAPPKVTQQPEPWPLSEQETAAWSARQLVISSPFSGCTDNYNTVVLPTEYEGAPAWRVYLIPASIDKSQAILTGHHRVTVSADGKTILKSEQLYKTCAIAKVDDAAAFALTDSENDEPIETHVFTSLFYERPLYVRTRKGTFAVDGVNITQVEPAQAVEASGDNGQ